MPNSLVKDDIRYRSNKKIRQNVNNLKLCHSESVTSNPTCGYTSDNNYQQQTTSLAQNNIPNDYQQQTTSLVQNNSSYNNQQQNTSLAQNNSSYDNQQLSTNLVQNNSLYNNQQQTTSLVQNTIPNDYQQQSSTSLAPNNSEDTSIINMGEILSDFRIMISRTFVHYVIRRSISTISTYKVKM